MVWDSGPSAETRPLRASIAAGIPPDSFMAIGSQGQYTIVIPPDDLANRKDRLAYPPNDDRVAVERLVRETHRCAAISEMMKWVQGG
jgi:hypothetical protein